MNVCSIYVCSYVQYVVMYALKSQSQAFHIRRGGYGLRICIDICACPRPFGPDADTDELISTRVAPFSHISAW